MAFYPLQSQAFSLSGSGVSIGDTVLNLKSFKDIGGTNIAMADLGTIAYLTLEPGNGTLEEQVSFTGVTQNADGSAQLTGIKTVLFKTPYTESSGFAKTHAGLTSAVLSNTAGFYNKFAILANDETITGAWLAPDPTATQGIATKNFVLSTVSSGATLKLDGLVPAATAGESVSAGNIVYLKSADGRWWKSIATDTTTLYGVQVGIAQGSGTAGNAITGGVLTLGYDSNQSGLNTGTTYYVSATAGVISSTAGANTLIVGQGGQTSSKLYFNPIYGLLPTPSQLSGFVATGTLSPYAGRTAPSGFLLCDGSAVSRATYATLKAIIAPSFTFTVTLATPGVFSATAHGLVLGDKVSLTTTGALPTGLATNTDYYVISAGLTADAFELSTSRGGSAVNTSGSQSGTHTLHVTNYGKGDGSTTFNVPDMRGVTPYGYKSSDTNFDVLNLPSVYPGEKTHVLTIAELAAHTHFPRYYTTGGAGSNTPGTTNATSNAQNMALDTSTTGGDTAHNNMPPYLVVNYIIKT